MSGGYADEGACMSTEEGISHLLSSSLEEHQTAMIIFIYT